MADPFELDPQVTAPLNLAPSQPSVVTPTGVPPSAGQEQATKRSPLAGFSGLQKFGLALEAFGAGVQGRKPLYAQLNEADLQRRRQNLVDTENRLQIVAQVTSQVQALPKGQRQAYLDAVIGQYDDPQLKELLKNSLNAPDMLSGLGEAVKNDPLIRSLTAQGKALDFVKTEAGQKYIREVQYPGFAQEWSGRLPEWQDWLRTNKPDEYQRIMKDGRLTTTEINGMIEQLPENLRPTPQSKSYFLGPYGQEKLTGVLGLPVITDKLAAKKLEQELAGGDATTLTKHLGELEEAERTLATATGDARKNAQRRVDALKKKISSETRGKEGGYQAMRDMYGQLQLKFLIEKGKNPEFQLAPHEIEFMQNVEKLDPFERILAKTREAEADQTVPQDQLKPDDEIIVNKQTGERKVKRGDKWLPIR